MPEEVDGGVFAERPPHPMAVGEDLPGAQPEGIGKIDRLRGTWRPRRWAGERVSLVERRADRRGGVVAEKPRRLDPHVRPQVGLDEQKPAVPGAP